jgi:IclR family acetate operon transcriptional repressor
MSVEPQADAAVLAPARLVPAVDRAVRLLHLLRRELRLWGISELAHALGLNRATVRDILLTLEHHGLVERDPRTPRYRLGAGLHAFAGALRNGQDLVAVARPFLRGLSERTGETALLAIPDGDRVLVLDKEEPPTDWKISAPLGGHLPLYTGSIGKVLLAGMEPARREQWLAARPPPRYTARSVAEPAAYGAVLAEVRRQGYALDDEEYLDGVRAASAPIHGAEPGILAVLTVVGFSTRLGRDRLAEVAAAVVAAAGQVSARLGGPGPELAPASGPGASANGEARGLR